MYIHKGRNRKNGKGEFVQMKDALAIIRNPVSTEKAVRLMESQNTLVFVVNSKVNKDEIAKAVEFVFRVKVDKVRIVNYENIKKAYVKLSPASNAMDVATELGMI